MTLTDDEKTAIESLLNSKHDYFHYKDGKFFVGDVIDDKDNMVTEDGMIQDSQFSEVMYRSILRHAFKIQLVGQLSAREAISRLVARLVLDIEALETSAKAFQEACKKDESLIIKPEGTA